MDNRSSPNNCHKKPSKRDTDESADPYLNEKPEREPAVCKECKNIDHNKQWYLPSQVDLEPAEISESFICPGCKKINNNYYLGELMISGKFVSPHRDEISHLIENEVDRAREKNPLQKLVEAEGKEGAVIMRTTNGKFAERLGRALNKAYKGDLEIDKSEPTIRVFWERNNLPQ